MSRYPFIIHACVDPEQQPFPSHTHGLHAITPPIPEIFINSEAFEAYTSGEIINLCYDQLKEKSGLLTKLRTGSQVILLEDLENKGRDIIGRLVNPLFGGVLAAYGCDVEASGEYLQIFVRNQPAVLEDSFYKVNCLGMS